eukprot:824902_1
MWLACIVAIVILQFIFYLRILPSSSPHPQEISLIASNRPNPLIDTEPTTDELFLCWRSLVTLSITTNTDELLPCHSSLWRDTETFISDIAIAL